MKRKLIALLLALALLLPGLTLGVSAADYTIGNPYQDVNWDTWGAYKTQLHVQTNASDGSVPLNEVVKEHYRLGYDILCLTDHMTLGVPWNQVPRAAPIMRLVKYERTHMLPITPLTDQERDDMLHGVGRPSGRPMMEVTRGVELNGAVPSNSHLQGFFCDFGQGFIGADLDWETPVKRNAKAGGVTTLNHLGEPAGAQKSNDPEYYDKNPKWVDKFAYLFLKYPSCLGMDVNSGKNDGTKFDAILYDRILAKTIPYGVLPWAFTYSDAHTPGEFDRAFTIHLMEHFNEADLRRSMEKGTFFGFGRHARLDKGDDFVGEGDPPVVSRIAKDDAAGTITVTASGYDDIVWVTNGSQVVARGVSTLRIADYDDEEIGSYVRAYLLSDAGILYIQPFTVLRAGQVLPKEKVCRPFDYSVPLSWLSDAFDFLAPKYSPLWFLEWLLFLFDPYIDLPWINWAALVKG
ncbi:MAG: hypothetical protein FWF60_00240 [Oscillospiraceae bacterium]|nr:hypothetical protein [Oscillospiraceae bacterium]